MKEGGKKHEEREDSKMDNQWNKGRRNNTKRGEEKREKITKKEIIMLIIT